MAIPFLKSPTTARRTTADVERDLNALAAVIRSHRPQLTRAESVELALREQPQLYSEYKKLRGEYS